MVQEKAAFRDPPAAAVNWCTIAVINLSYRNAQLGRSLFSIPTPRRTTMDREHVKGAADKAKGAIKEGAGKLTGDKDMEAEGKLDKAKGSAHNVAGDVKDAARDAADALKK
jgi:uncharacterized protein YjbJ (UPF0337 family)